MPSRPFAGILVASLLLLSACADKADRAPADAAEAEAMTDAEPAVEAQAADTMTVQSPCFLQAIEVSHAGSTAAERGQLFLEANGKCEGVHQTESGLQYEVVVAGEGERPTATSVVDVHYEGTLIDGTVFDSSYRRGESIQFPLNRVIPGWTEGVGLMPVGSTYRLFIPSELAYGSRGAPGAFGPDETLIFKVELLSIVE